MTDSTLPDTSTVGADGWTAIIIPFPRAQAPAEPAPQDRLARALASLNAALDDQRIAVAAWRAALGDLKTTTAGLHDSLHSYRTNLQTLGDAVTSLRAKAQSLEQWADQAVATFD